MQVEQLNSAQGLSIDGPLLITLRAFGDDRGWFYESWNQTRFNEAAGETVHRLGEIVPRQDEEEQVRLENVR